MRQYLIDEIEDAVITPDRIRWIGSQDGKYTLPWDIFKKRFGNIVYDTEDPRTELASDLVIKMFDGSWYERDLTTGEWVHKRVPEEQPDSQQYDYVAESDSPLGSIGFDPLEYLNDKDLMTTEGNDYATK